MSPMTPQSFVRLVVEAVGRVRADASVKAGEGLSVRIDGHPVYLDNLWRMVLADTASAETIIARYFEQILSEENSGNGYRLGWYELKPQIMPRIQSDEVFQRIEPARLPHRPWINGTVITFVRDHRDSMVSLLYEDIEGWGVGLEELDSTATANLIQRSALPRLRVKRHDSGGKHLLVRQCDGYDSARLLDEELRMRIAAELGPTYLVGIPARDLLIAFSTEPHQFSENMATWIGNAFERMPYPITPHRFLVTRDGIAGTLDHEVNDEPW